MTELSGLGCRKAEKSGWLPHSCDFSSFPYALLLGPPQPLFSVCSPSEQELRLGVPDSPLPKVRAPHTWGVGGWAPGELGDSKIKTKPYPPSLHPFS